MQYYYAFLALDLAHERAREAEAQRLAALGSPGEPRTSALRRTIARFALAVARAADDEVARLPLVTH